MRGLHGEVGWGTGSPPVCATGATARRGLRRDGGYGRQQTQTVSILFAEIQRGWVKRLVGGGRPEIELIATAATVKATQEAARYVN